MQYVHNAHTHYKSTVCNLRDMNKHIYIYQYNFAFTQVLVNCYFYSHTISMGKIQPQKWVISIQIILLLILSKTQGWSSSFSNKEVVLN